MSRKKVKLMKLEVQLQRVKIPDKEQSICSGDILAKSPQTSHKGKKPTFSCSYFPKALTRSGDLDRHLWTHTGEKPFRCSYCPKAFTTSVNLQSISGSTLEKSPSVAVVAQKHLKHQENLKHISGPTLEKSPSNVSGVHGGAAQVIT